MKRIFASTLVLIAICITTNCYAAKALKKTIAVFKFGNESGFASQVDLGQDFSDQLSDALVQSGRFIVLTRKDLDVVMGEQDLSASGRMAKSNTAQTGKIVPAQILIKGNITEFEEQSSGGGQGLTVKGFTIGAKKQTAHIAVIIQIIDSTTGEILDSQRVEGESASGGLTLGYSGDFDIGSSNFKKTPLGKSIQIAIDNAVELISKKMDNISWKGRVISVKEDGTIFVNAGANSNIKSGDKFSVFREGEALIDPDTGMDLGSEKTKIADIEVSSVEEKFAKAKVAGSAQTPVQKGDVVSE